MFLHRGHRRAFAVAGRGYGGDDEPEWRLRHSRSRLRGGERVDESGEDYPVVHGDCQQDGVEERIIINTLFFTLFEYLIF